MVLGINYCKHYLIKKFVNCFCLKKNMISTLCIKKSRIHHNDDGVNVISFMDFGNEICVRYIFNSDEILQETLS